MDELVFFSDFAERECPWFRADYSTNSGYGCAHPSQADVEVVAVPAIGGDFHNDGVYWNGPKCLVDEGRCYSFSCPLGYQLHPKDEPADAQFIRDHGEDPDDYSDGDGFWLLRDALPSGEAKQLEIGHTERM